MDLKHQIRSRYNKWTTYVNDGTYDTRISYDQHWSDISQLKRKRKKDSDWINDILDFDQPMFWKGWCCLRSLDLLSWLVKLIMSFSDMI